MSKQKTLLSWSSGKDSAWALHCLRQNAEIEILGLFSTINEEYERVAMHAVRVELLRKQAESIGLPLHLIPIPHPCSNADYEAAMREFVEQVKEQGIECFAFGDLYLENVRCYREKKLADTGIRPIFPLWGLPTDKLAREMTENGLRAQLTCVDPKILDAKFSGREFNQQLLSDLPDNVDPCGENGEFHSFAFDGPMFSRPIPFSKGEILERDGFVFTDLLLADNSDYT